MTEAEWLASDDPVPMLEILQDKTGGERKWRLFAVACCRRLWHYPLEGMDAPGSPWIAAIRDAVAIGERRADGQATAEEIEDAERLSGSGVHVLYAFIGCAGPDGEELREVSANLLDAAGELTGDSSTSEADRRSEAAAHCKLLRCIFGNPFKKTRRQRKWTRSDALSLARQMYDSRDFSAMPILADALQDAGCDNDDILNHCRDATATHVRGCWVVDLVLGRK